MKKLLYSLLTLAGLLTAASCQPDKLIGDKDGGDGKAADISITVSLGPKTKAFADGTKADKLFAGLYEIGNGPTYTHITHTAEAIAIDNEMRATVTFNGQIHRGNSYRLVFWAQKDGAPYTIDWATAATTGPTVTVNTYSGNTNLANDDTRDAFFGFYDAENVQGNVEVTEQNAIQLKRPFAQVNVLVPIANITTPAGAVASTMTVAQAPTVLNLATKATSAPEDWAFASNAIDEDPFAAYAPNDPNDPATHKYVAMNYVLVDQLAADARYDVGFTVSASAGVQTSGDKAVANVPLKPNGRTNIVGNVFSDDFNISVPIIVSPGAGTEQELTTVTVAVGQTSAEAFELTPNTISSVEVAINHTIENESEKPEITVTPASIATAEWNLTTGKLDVTPLVANGNAVITLVFPAVTKTEYSAATVELYVKVGNGINATATTLSIDPATLSVQLGQTADFMVTASAGVGTIGIDPVDNAYFSIALKGQDGQNYTYTVTPKAETTDAVTVTASGTATNENYSDPDPVTIAISVAAKPTVAQSVSFGENNASTITFGSPFTVPTPTTENLAPNTSLVYSLGDGTTEGAFSITDTGVLTINHVGTAKIVATAPEVDAADKFYSSASDTYTLTVNKQQLSKPAAPTVQKSGNDGIEVSWVANANAASYTLTCVGYSAAAQTFTGITATTYSIEGLSDDTYVVTVKAIAAVDGDYADSAESEASEEVVIAVPVTNTIADIIAQITSTDNKNPSNYTANLAGAVVSYVNGQNVYLEDASGAILLYKENAGLTVGQTISGTVSGTGYKYNGLPEITDLGTAYTAASGGTVPETTMTLADLLADYDNNISRRIKLESVTVTDGINNSDRDGAISQNSASIAVRAQSNTLTLNANEIGDLIAFPTVYNTNKQLSYYDASQFNKTGIVPVLSAKNSDTVNANVTEYTWSIASNTAWTITPGEGVTAANPDSGNGNGDVTLSFAANTSTEAKTLTAKVSADGCADVTITITQNGTGTTTNPRYVKVTSTSDLTDGVYLIVYETGSLAFNGGLQSLDVVSNTISVTISNDVIAQSTTVDAAAFTIASIEGGYSIKSASGVFIGRTATSNGMSTSDSAILNTITFESSGSATIKSNGLNLRYNKASNQTRFRYFTSEQEVIYLYKYTE